MSPEKQLLWWHLTVARLGGPGDGNQHMTEIKKSGLIHVPDPRLKTAFGMWWSPSDFNVMAGELAKAKEK